MQNPLALEFILGGFAALVFRRVGPFLAGVIAITGFVVLAFSSAGPSHPLLVGCGFALILIAVTAFESRRGIGPFARLTVFGDMSYSIYLCHVLVLAVTGRAWMALASHVGSNTVIIVLWWVITLAAVLTTGYLSYRLIERPVIGLSSRWRGKVFARPVGSVRSRS